MEFLNSKRFILLMLVLLVWVGVSGCSPLEFAEKQSPHETTAEMNADITKDMDAMDREQEPKDPGAPNFTGIAEILGCMFAPDECIPEKRKAEKEMDR